MLAVQAHQGAATAPAVLDDPDAEWLVEQFRAHYHEKRAWKRLTWLGVPVRQYPNDLLVIQEVIEQTRPELLIETGTHSGGSALFYAGVFDALGGGEVVSVDIDHSNVHSRAAAHPRITLIQADSTSTATHEQLARIAGGRCTMLVLDGDHRQAAVAAELRGLAELVSVGCYAIVFGHEPRPPAEVEAPAWPLRGCREGLPLPSVPNSRPTVSASTTW